MVAKILPPDRLTPPTLGMGSINFQNMVMLLIKLKGITKCSSMVANILPADPSPFHVPGLGSKGQNETFSEHGHVAYQIKENHECSNMIANILPADPLPLPPFSEHGHVAYKMKGNHEKQHCSKYFARIPPG